MKELTDEEIQSLLEDGLKPSGQILSAVDKDHLDSYHSLFQQLKTEPEQGLPFNFASTVTRQLKIKLKRQSDIRFNLLAALGIIIGLAAAYGFLSLADHNSANAFMTAIIKFKWVLIFGTAVLLGSLIFDQAKVEEVV